MAAPIYHDLSIKIKQYIKDNDLTGKLPGTRTLSKIFKVHHVTLSKALHLLEDEGVVVFDGTSGIYVAENERSKTNYNVLAVVGCNMEYSWKQKFLTDIRKELSDFNYDLMGITFEKELFFNNKKILFNFPVDGFIFRFSALRNEQAKLLMQAKIPFVACARRKDLPEVDQTDCDHDYGYGLLLDELIKLGHRRIAFCEFGRVPEYQRYLKDIYNLFKEKLGNDFNSDYFYVRETGLELWEKYGEEYWNIYPNRAVEYFLSLKEPPTAIISPAQLFRRIYNILRNRKIRIPEDISMMSMSYVDEKLPDADVSGIVYDEKKMLAWAVMRVAEKIKNPDLPTAYYLQKPVFNQGKTVTVPPSNK